jgi:hypothetical protein
VAGVGGLKKRRGSLTSFEPGIWNLQSEICNLKCNLESPSPLATAVLSHLILDNCCRAGAPFDFAQRPSLRRCSGTLSEVEP